MTMQAMAGRRSQRPPTLPQRGSLRREPLAGRRQRNRQTGEAFEGSIKRGGQQALFHWRKRRKRNGKGVAL